MSDGGKPIVLTAPLTETIDYAGYFIQMALASMPVKMEKVIDRAARSEFLPRKNLLAEELNCLGIERLLEKVHGAEFHGLHRSAHGSIGGQHDHRHLGSKTSQKSKHFQAVHLRHLDVDKGDIVAPVFHAKERIIAVAGGIHLVPFGFQHHAEIIANITLVIDDENANL